MSDTFTLIVDVKQRRPGCALIQAVGGDTMLLKQLFDAESWLVAPTPDMYSVTGTLEQWEDFAAECRQRFPLPRLKP